MLALIPAILIILLAFTAQSALAHEGQPPAPHDFWYIWNLQPALLSSMAIGAWIYLRGLRVLRSRSSLQRAVWGRRTGCFLAGLAALAVALISPLDALGSALFSAHMLQHMLLILAAPPLLVAAVPLHPVLHAFSPFERRKLGQAWKLAKKGRAAWQAFTHPPVAWTLHALALWAWHVPVFYETALRDEAVHIMEHLGFLGTALLFWWVILRPTGRARNGGGSEILALFTMALQSGLLGALLTFASTPWYAAYAATTQAWGLTPLEDQQLAGAIMWIPAGTIYTLAAVVLFFVRLAGIERNARRREIQGK